jgi:hypothetical protein
MRKPNKASGKRVLFASELGSNLGHVVPLSRIARQLRLDYIEPFFASSNLEAASIALNDADIPFLQSPVWPSWHVLDGNQDGQSGYLDVLAQIGFGDPNKLTAIMSAWKALIDIIKPDLVILDHSPALSSLLQALNLPAIAIGSGFTLPPVDYDFFPAYRSDRAPLVPEKKLLRSLTQALANLSLPAPVNLISSIFPKDRFVCSFPELDYYKNWRTETLYSPLEGITKNCDTPRKVRMFVYLGAELPGFDEVVKCLAEVDFEIECYLRGAPESINTFLKMRGHKVYNTPPDLAEVLPRVSHVFSQGGNGICHTVMAAGRPHFMIPLHGESEFNLNVLANLNVARRIPGHLKAADLKKTLEAHVADHELHIRAKQWASLVNTRQQKNGLEALTVKILELL